MVTLPESTEPLSWKNHNYGTVVFGVFMLDEKSVFYNFTGVFFCNLDDSKSHLLSEGEILVAFRI
jgi:hypothetical protein